MRADPQGRCPRTASHGLSPCERISSTTHPAAANCERKAGTRHSVSVYRWAELGLPQVDRTSPSLLERGVDATAGTCCLCEPTEHGDEVFTRDMEQTGTRPDAVVGRARALRVRKLVGQRVQPVSAKAVGAQQIDKGLCNVCAPDAQPSTLELTGVSPAPAADLQDPTRSTERGDERVDLAGHPLGHRRRLCGVIGRRGLIRPDRFLVGAHASLPRRDRVMRPRDYDCRHPPSRPLQRMQLDSTRGSGLSRQDPTRSTERGDERVDLAGGGLPSWRKLDLAQWISAVNEELATGDECVGDPIQGAVRDHGMATVQRADSHSEG